MTFLKLCVKNIGLILPLKAGSIIEKNARFLQNFKFKLYLNCVFK